MEDIEFDMEELRELVSPAIFDFLSDTSTDANPSAELSLVHAVSASPGSTRSNTFALDDHHPPVNAPPPLGELDDALLLACSQQFEEEEEEELNRKSAKRIKVDPAVNQSSSTSSKRVFAAPKNEDEIAKAKLSAIPDTTLVDTNYCVRMWKQWCDHRHSVYGDTIPSLEEISVSELATSYLK